MLRATSANFSGWLNREDAKAVSDYSAEMEDFRSVSDLPVFSFEVGQYEVLPDFREIGDYHGVTVPCNLIQMERKMHAAGLENLWPRMVNATGENALQCYRAEVEAAMRTEEFSGISLLSLQDFPGQGTALVGMMNAHLQPKPYSFADPARFAAFFRDVLPMALLPEGGRLVPRNLDAVFETDGSRVVRDFAYCRPAEYVPACSAAFRGEIGCFADHLDFDFAFRGELPAGAKLGIYLFRPPAPGIRLEAVFSPLPDSQEEVTAEPSVYGPKTFAVLYRFAPAARIMLTLKWRCADNEK